MSNFVLHLTKGGEASSKAYDNFMGIVGNGQLRPGPNPFGCLKSVKSLQSTHRSVCFSEIPFGNLERLYERRSFYGIGFAKSLLQDRGGAPIWYLERGTPAQQALDDLIAKADASDPDNPLWKLTPFIDYTNRDFKSGRPYQFEWEREWRHPGAFNFQPPDVAFLLIPEFHHDDAREFFKSAVADNLGPGYFCPYIDVRWGQERSLKALKAG